MYGALHCRKGLLSGLFIQKSKVVLQQVSHTVSSNHTKLSFIAFIVNEPCSYFLKVDSHIHASKQRTGKEYGDATFAMVWKSSWGHERRK